MTRCLMPRMAFSSNKTDVKQRAKTSAVDAYLDGQTHRVPIASINVLSVGSNIRRRARELKLDVTLKQEGNDLLIVSRKKPRAKARTA